MFTEDEDEDQEQGKKNQGPIMLKERGKKEGFETEKHKDLFRCRGQRKNLGEAVLHNKSPVKANTQPWCCRINITSLRAK